MAKHNVRSPSPANFCNFTIQIITATANKLSGRRGADYIQVLLSFIFDVLVSRLQMIINDGVGPFAIKADLAVRPTQDDRHSFTYVVEIQDTQQLVNFYFAHHLGILT